MKKGQGVQRGLLFQFNHRKTEKEKGAFSSTRFSGAKFVVSHVSKSFSDMANKSGNQYHA